MLDPITAVATATTAFNLIKKGIAFGNDLDTMSKSLSRWYGAVSDFNYAEQEVNNTGGISKLLMKGSIEQMALDITMNRQKIQEQEKELRTLITYAYGPTIYNEMIELRRKLRKQREKEIYRKRELRRSIVEGCLIISLIVLLGLLLVGGVYLFSK